MSQGTSSRQRHRNIVSIIGLCLESRHPYVISEYVDGQCVKDFIKRGGGLLNWPLRVKLLTQIADGMAFLHSTKPPILHRDLRCANLFITERDIVKVADFGLIHLTQPLRSACREEDCCCQGKYSACPPSISWTAPEVFAHPNSNESDGFITKAADVYSFGIVMWEIVMCEDPFDEIGSTKEVIEHVLSGGRPEIAGNAVILPQYKTLMQSCWDRDPENRPTFKQICVRMKELLFQARSFQKSIYNRRLKLQKDLSVKISRDSTSEPLNNTSSELP
ncbi:hypothetical protein ACJMK2_007636 [Sinanodonta woodiana]|uniref:Protein kinase domain-containing protein n=1 Tax=Sinanodonta woodiana TaxID=1069815 RepID=A0ABD3VKD2_SINWO